MSSRITFIADCMLGRLSRWLRICGFDTVYYRKIDDSDLLKKAGHEGRIILTRDKALFRECQKEGLQAVFILDNHFEEQLKQIFKQLHISSFDAFTQRCLDCNTLLQRVKKSEIIDKVPRYVFTYQEQFFICPRCKKIFWAGTHLKHMKKKLDTIFGDKNESSQC